MNRREPVAGAVYSVHVEAAGVKEWLTPLLLAPGSEAARDTDAPFIVSAQPNTLGRAGAEQLLASLRAGALAPGASTSVLFGRDGGKMFGTLVVRDAEGRIGVLKAFSGQLDRTWDLEGFVPPVFDRAAREAIEPRGERCVRELTARVIAARDSSQWAATRLEFTDLKTRHAAQEAALLEQHRARRLLRQAARERSSEGHAALDSAARQDETEHRSVKTRMRGERAPLEAALAGFQRRLQRVRQHRVAASRIVSRQLYDSYVFTNGLGQTKTLRELFPNGPPSGAGDCAAPKLVGFALEHGLQPLALAEFWWGRAPRSGNRGEGVFYAPCEEKCRAVLTFLLAGHRSAPAAAEP